MTRAIARIKPADIAEDHARVPFAIETAGGSAPSFGQVAYTRSGDRVYAETHVDGECVISHKITPGEPRNEFTVVVDEVSRITELTLPVTTDDLDGIAAVVHAYVTNGRPEWG